MKHKPSSLLKRISAAVSIFIAAATAILSALGGYEWIVCHLPLLGTGLASLISGAAISYTAIERIRADRMLPLIVLWSGVVLFFSGCASDSASQTLNLQVNPNISLLPSGFPE